MIECKECKHRFVCFTLSKKERYGCPVEYILLIDGSKLNGEGDYIHRRGDDGCYQWGWEQLPSTMTYRTRGGAVRLKRKLIKSGEYKEGEIKIARLEILPD